MFSLHAASQLASLLIVIVFVVIVLEQQFRSRMRYAENKRTEQTQRIQLTGWHNWLVTGFVPCAFCFWHFCYRLRNCVFGPYSRLHRLRRHGTWNFSGIHYLCLVWPLC